MTKDELIEILLSNRGLTTPEQQSEFFNPVHPNEIPSPFSGTSVITLLKKHIENHDKIGIFGDYDVDGVCATAILWETLYSQHADVIPFIPHRRNHGYGLSQKGIDELLAQEVKLIIAVDCGIVAHEAIKYAKSKNCDVIVIDHHEADGTLLSADGVLHSTSSSAAGLVWLFARDLVGPSPELTEKLSLVALSVICDMIPLIGMNRSFAKYGLLELNSTHRPGLLALFELAGINPQNTPIGTYQVGFVIGPRINAMGRLEHAMDSLRLLCTTDPVKARTLARSLTETNKLRQDLTDAAIETALTKVNPEKLPSVVVVADESFDEGVVGLIAAKLVEKFYRPAIALSCSDGKVKGSARSIPGFNITDHLRKYTSLLTSVGGHAMAAGLSLLSENLNQFVDQVSQVEIDQQLLIRTYKYELELPLDGVSSEIKRVIDSFAPFGLGNPQPVLRSQGGNIATLRRMGVRQQHLKWSMGTFDVVYFNCPHQDAIFKSNFYMHYTLDENTWNGKTTLQLLIRHFEPIIV